MSLVGFELLFWTSTEMKGQYKKKESPVVPLDSEDHLPLPQNQTLPLLLLCSSVFPALILTSAWSPRGPRCPSCPPPHSLLLSLPLLSFSSELYTSIFSLFALFFRWSPVTEHVWNRALVMLWASQIVSVACWVSMMQIQNGGYLIAYKRSSLRQSRIIHQRETLKQATERKFKGGSKFSTCGTRDDCRENPSWKHNTTAVPFTNKALAWRVAVTTLPNGGIFKHFVVFRRLRCVATKGSSQFHKNPKNSILC